MTPALLRIVETYRRPLRPAITRAALSALLVLLVAGALLGRYGTPATRGGALAAIAVGVLALLLHRWLDNRRFSSLDGAIAASLGNVDAAQGDKARRALRLAQDTAQAPRGQSAELARLHFERMLERANLSALERSAARSAGRWKAVATLGLLVTGVTAFALPWHLVEGIDVLAARRGQAPVKLQWLELSEISSSAPTYLRQKPAPLTLETANSLPEGSELLFRGKPLRPGRNLVLTDGTKEVPFVDDANGEVVARWTLDATVELHVAARFGRVLISEPQSIQVDSRTDERPRVNLKGAPAELALDTLERLELLWSASDDHNLVQVDLVLRSAGKEERRSLESFPGDKRTGQGGYVLYPSDAFLKRVFLPVIVRIEARDNDPREGSKWGESPAFILRPPGVGMGQLARYNALLGLRSRMLDWLASLPLPDEKLDTERELDQVEQRATLSEIENYGRKSASDSYTSLTVPQGWSVFLEGQFERLGDAIKKRKGLRTTLESVVLGLSSGLDSLASSDSRTVAKQLGDVADEMAFAARLAQQAEGRRDARVRLDLAIDVLAKGASDLTQLGVLGADLGSVATADLGRVQRSRDREDYFHAELAALHMAERLHRPNPSFGAKGGGGGGGVESGSGSSGGGNSDAKGKPSEADKEFQRRAQDLEQLAQDHADLGERTSSALQHAEDAARGTDNGDEARQRAEALRNAVMRLPQPGENPGTGRASAALAREHSGAMAHELEQQHFDEALQNGRRAQSAADEALSDPDLDPFTRGELERAKQELAEQVAWAEAQAQRVKQQTENAAREALGEFGHLERELSERANRLSADDLKEASLPAEMRRRLEEASQLMQQAAQRLGEGKGEEAMDLQRQAQRLLEESETGQMQEPDSKGNQDGGDDDGDGRHMRTGGEVPNQDPKNRAEDFRRRVLEGLGAEGGGRLSPAIKRYAEGLLR